MRAHALLLMTATKPTPLPTQPRPPPVAMQVYKRLPQHKVYAACQVNQNSTFLNLPSSTEKQPPRTGAPTAPPSPHLSGTHSYDPKRIASNMSSIDTHPTPSITQVEDPLSSLYSAERTGSDSKDNDPTGNEQVLTHSHRAHSCKIRPTGPTDRE